MQAPGFHASHLPALSSGDPVRASVAHLLSRASTLPCTAAAQAFAQLVQPTARFQLALDALLPPLSSNAELSQRILVSYILYSLYASHPVAMNPFRCAFVEVFTRESDRAKVEADRGGASETEQLVWVLWKILKGDGNDLGPYSPTTLARSPLPPKLRATNLTLDEEHNEDSFSDQYERPEPASAINGSNGFMTRNVSTPSQEESSAQNDHSNQHNTTKDDFKNDSVAHGMNLLLAARSRVLTLSEQRTVASVLHALTSTPVIAASDLPSLISLNPTLGHPLVVSLLSVSPVSQTSPQGARACLDVLQLLPPSLPSFDILGRLLRDPTPVADLATSGRTTVADLLRTEVLGAFLLNSIDWIERAEHEEREGLISDDRVAKGVQNLCRFYNSLIKLDIVDPASDADSTAMAHFALSHSRFEEANALYRVLVMGKF